MDGKIKAVQNHPGPQRVDEARSFLGLCGYYRSVIQGFSNIVAPLAKLLRKEQSFHCDAAQEKSFQVHKIPLTNAAVLAFPDYSAPFVLYTDTSATGICAILVQQDDRGKKPSHRLRE